MPGESRPLADRGGMAERPKAVVLKTTERKLRGFESLSPAIMNNIHVVHETNLVSGLQIDLVIEEGKQMHAQVIDNVAICYFILDDSLNFI